MKEEEIRKQSAFDQYLKLVADDVKKFFTDRSKFIRVACPACGSNTTTKQFEKLGFAYELCEVCETLFVNPRPPFEKLIQFYSDSESTSFFVNGFFKPVAEARRIKIFRPRVDYIVERFKNHPVQVIGDIGAGFGIFLEELKLKWPQKRLIAIEPSREMAEICGQKGLEVIPQMLEEVKNMDSSFDLLCSFELFEHLYHPEEFLKKCYQLLKPGGHLIFTTLSGTGFDIQILWEKSKSVSPPHHLNFFNPKSAAVLLEKSGFQVEEAVTPGKLDWDILQGAMKQDDVQVERFWKYCGSHLPESAKEELQAWIVKNNLSSHMRVLARKN